MHIHKKTLYWQILITVAVFTLSFLFAARFNQTNSDRLALGSQSFEALSNMMVSLSEKRDTLYVEYASLFTELEEMQEAQTSGQSMLASLLRQRNSMQIITGSITVKGAGISVSIPQNNKLMKYDLIDIINELYLSGANIIAVNGSRLNLHSSFGEKYGATGNNILTLNGEILEYPIVITALGDPATLEKGLSYTGGVINNLNIFYDIYPEITQEENIVISTILK